MTNQFLLTMLSRYLLRKAFTCLCFLLPAIGNAQMTKPETQSARSEKTVPVPTQQIGPAISAPQASQGEGKSGAQFAPVAHGAAFTWPQSITPGITSNALYCGTVSGSYSLKWAFPSPATSFDWLTTDVTNPPVQAQKYFCAVTASIAGIESGYSPEYSFTFPQVPLAPAGLSTSTH